MTDVRIPNKYTLAIASILAGSMFDPNPVRKAGRMMRPRFPYSTSKRRFRNRYCRYLGSGHYSRWWQENGERIQAREAAKLAERRAAR